VGGGLEAAVISSAQSAVGGRRSRAWWSGGRAAGRGVAAGLRPGDPPMRRAAWTPQPGPPSAAMFDNSNYPFNCFNYDGDGYPSSSTDEEKKMCRPAYRYGPLASSLAGPRHFMSNTLRGFLILYKELLFFFVVFHVI